jgi:ribosomal protein S4
MFASSLRQARQFVVHGYVNVNGKKVRQLHTPSHILLNLTWALTIIPR